MNYAQIKPLDIANGDGIRVSLFVSGCTHRCRGCFNAAAWDFSCGSPYTREVEDRIVGLLEPSYVAGLSLLGGEPFEPRNQEALLPLVRRVRGMSGKDIWAYTGYDYAPDLLPGGRAHCGCTDEILDSLEVLVDGRFVEALKDISLRFRGSSNQRILDMRALHGASCGRPSLKKAASL